MTDISRSARAKSQKRNTTGTRWADDPRKGVGTKDIRDENVRPETQFGPLSTEDLAGLLYSMGRAFDGLKTSRLNTLDFLKTGDPTVLASKQDRDLLEDLKDATHYVTNVDFSEQPIDLDFLSRINSHLTRSAAISPGKLRERSGDIGVNTPLGVYIPPAPDRGRLSNMISDLAEETDTCEDTEQLLRAASRLFVEVAKTQPYSDGNKRTGFLAANSLLLKNKAGFIITVPTENPEASMFNTALAEWYLHDDLEVVEMLTDFNLSQLG